MSHIPSSLSAVRTALSAGELKPSELLELVIAGVMAREPDLHAWTHLDLEGARSAAIQADGMPSEKRGPLWGVPFAVKDIIDVAGMPTRCGSVITSDEPAQADASVVARVRKLGGIPLGKTVTTEFAYFAPGPTTNPHDPTRTPGGSSSGSAAVVGAGLVPLALGTQTLASTTRPAAYCGATSLVMNPSAMTSSGITGLSRTFDTLGWLVRHPVDLQELLVTLGMPADDVLPRRVLVWDGHDAPVEPEMCATLAAAAATLAGVGCLVEPVQTDLAPLQRAHRDIMAHESAQERTDAASVPSRISDQLNELLTRGRSIDKDIYEQALSTLEDERSRFESLLADAVILAPGATGVAPRGLGSTGNPEMSRPVQALGLETVCVPGGWTKSAQDGGAPSLPMGLQLAGTSRERALTAGKRIASLPHH